ncbi:hypothetical protein ACWDZ8_25620, partial [Streptomyces sp. NPDC003233]
MSFERSRERHLEEASPDYSEMSGRSDRPRTSDKVGTAGKETARKRGSLESAEEIGSRKDLIESETPKGSARRKAREGE